MLNKLLVVTALLSITACGKGIYAKGEVAYEYVGCNKVTQNPAETGERAFIGFTDLKKGDHVLFKRVDNNGDVGPVITAIPC
jgi:hypothetical protein|tara:strand:+ start:7916 stop:8161 length:246 start_codon:yes stop_codon:yes gene_type:complete